MVKMGCAGFSTDPARVRLDRSALSKKTDKKSVTRSMGCPSDRGRSFSFIFA